MEVCDRRTFLAGVAAVVAAAPTTLRDNVQDRETMYGLIGKIDAVDGQRDALIEILIDGVAGMPGCLSYVVAKDMDDENALWVTEVWDSKDSHEASLSLPSVQAAISAGRPLIAGFSSRSETEPVGGHGLG